MDKKYYQLDLAKWEANYAYELNVKNASSNKGGKGFSANYVPYHDVQFALRKLEPDLVFEVEEVAPVGSDDNLSYMILCHLYHQPSGLRTPTMRYPVMRHGVGQHAAVIDPTSREISDSLKRAFVRCVAEETGIGYSLWVTLEPDPEDAEEEEVKKTSRRGGKKVSYEIDFDESLDDDDDDDDDLFEDDDDEVEAAPTRRNRTSRAPRGGRRRG